jgi:hypothetical protein
MKFSNLVNVKVTSNTIEAHFENVSYLVDIATPETEAQILEGRSEDLKKHVKEELKKHSVQNNPRKWNGNASIYTVRERMLKPTPKAAEAIKTSGAVFDIENLAMQAPRRRTRRGLEDGDEIDTDRYLQRNAAMWEESERTTTPKTCIKIGVNIATDCSQKEESFKYRTAAILAICEICEHLNIQTEIYGCHYVKSCTSTQFLKMEFPIKRPEQYLDIESTAYILGSIDFFRVSVLSAQAFIIAALYFINCIGLGKPRSKTQDEAEENEFILKNECYTQEDATEEVNRFIEFLKGRKAKKEEEE